ncbi:MAG: methionyl-tRNA formyltransferase [Ruminococcaceae bacterium]|nr:methionyl-tRNA formyltransferase [Oscillospiraceae bacterium]
MRILFMGTPDFALFSLRAMVEAGENIIGVITQPDKPKGRGYALLPPPVKVYAEQQGIPVYQPNTLRGDEFQAFLEEQAPDLIVVVAYGKILPQNVLDFPRFGCINIHGSLLPEYRGAAPMQRAVMDGKTKSGITTILMDAGIDTGDMLLTGEIDISEADNFETVHDKLGACGAEVMLRTLDALKAGTLTRVKQDHSRATYAAKIEKADCLIDFSRSAAEVHNQIRGLSPIPLAFTHTADGKMLKVIASEVADRTAPHTAVGEVLSLQNGKITVACAIGAVNLLTVLPEGKKRMPAADFINGRKVQLGDVLN